MTGRRRLAPAPVCAAALLLTGCLASHPYRGRGLEMREAAALTALTAADRPMMADSLRLVESSEPACHNCYDPDLLADFARAPRFSSTVEIDIQDHAIGRLRRGTRGWYVRHAGWMWGNYSNCAPTPSRGDLRACLAVVRRWLRDDERRPLMLVFIDKKQGWGGHLTPLRLDSLIAEAVPAERIFTPGRMRGGSPSVRAAAAANAWPTLSSLRGQVAFVLTGSNAWLSRYAREAGDGALAFVAPGVRNAREVEGAPAGFDTASVKSVAFYNFRAGGRARDVAARAHALHFFTRVWLPVDDVLLNRCKYVRAGINRIARYRDFAPLPSPKACKVRVDGVKPPSAEESPSPRKQDKLYAR